MIKFKTILVEQRAGVVEIQLNRPAVRNAIDEVMIDEMTTLFKTLSNSNEIRLIILSGHGKCFCSGADIKAMKNVDDGIQSLGLQKMLLCIDHCPHPIVAILHGTVMGGGIGIAACCDEVIANNQTQFCFPEVRLGLMPAIISPFVFSKIGFSSALALSLSARKFDCAHAKSIDLVHHSFDHDNIAKEISKTIEHYSNSGLEAMKKIKQYLKKELFAKQNDEVHTLTSRLITEMRKSDEAQEGMKAMLEKRKPSWVTNHE